MEYPAIHPCPWCGHEAQVELSGHYTSGWQAYVCCTGSEAFKFCGARGPTIFTKGPSNEDIETIDKAIEAWNSVKTAEGE